MSSLPEFSSGFHEDIVKVVRSKSLEDLRFQEGLDDEDLAKLLPEEEEEKSNLKETVSEFLTFRSQSTNTDAETSDNTNTKTSDNTNADISDRSLKTVVKRKRKQEEEDSSLHLLTEVFLRIIYPLSRCMTKNIVIGIFKSLDFVPAVLLNHSGKTILFTENAWDSFEKHTHLIECYLFNNVFGRKTGIRLAGSDIEVDIVKLRGAQCVRFRDLTKHDCKVQLTMEEFNMMSSVTPAVNRYLKQLIFSGPIVKDYLIDTIDYKPDAPLLEGPVDTSIYNRLPQEVQIFRRMNHVTKQWNDVAEEECNIEDTSDKVQKTDAV